MKVTPEYIIRSTKSKKSKSGNFDIFMVVQKVIRICKHNTYQTKYIFRSHNLKNKCGVACRTLAQANPKITDCAVTAISK